MPSTIPDAFFRHPLKPRACGFFGVYACSGPAEWGDILKKRLNFKIRNANSGVLQKACETPLPET